MPLRPLRSFLLLAIALLSTSVITLAEELRLPAVFGEHMVLQRGIAVPVWGWGEPGAEVVVEFRNQRQTTKIGEDGKWRLSLESMTVGEPASLAVVSGGKTLTFSDVLVGEVWVCSGQSNMQWSVDRAIDFDLEAARANRPNLRLFQVPLVSKAEPQEDVDADWRICAPDNVGSFSAVAYYFGVNLQETLGVPVGLIQTAWGGTRAEAWASPEKLAEVEVLQPIIDTWAEKTGKYDADKVKQAYDASIEKWKVSVAQAKAEDRKPPGKPQFQKDPRLSQHHPSNLYNAMVVPLVPYAIRGAIWYQGESNAGRAYQYRTLMPAMIQSWRDTWGQGDFHFYQVQLANFRDIVEEPIESDWAELREAQFMTAAVIPNAGSACITDLGAAKDIHPKNKQDVGKRLARLALVDVYGLGDGIVRNGPTYKEVSIEGNKVTLTFDVGDSLLSPYYRQQLTGFAVAGEDREWVWANATITGKDTVEVWNEDVEAPVAVRYNWTNNPQGNLYNTHHLPAYPFRTDDWEGVTVNNVTP